MNGSPSNKSGKQSSLSSSPTSSSSSSFSSSSLSLSSCLSCSRSSIILLILSNLLVYQLARIQFTLQQFNQNGSNFPSFGTYENVMTTPLVNNNQNNNNNNHNNNNQNNNMILHHPLNLPQGTAQALPSIRISAAQEEKEEEKDESIPKRHPRYGGAGDAKHLGGFIDIDMHGVSPATWKFMITYFGIKSILDVGCGRGISTSWFILHGVDALCIEGSHDAWSKTVLPHPETQMIEHDYSRGPWWPSSNSSSNNNPNNNKNPKTYDAVWCVEFLEHVGRNYHHHYLPTFRMAALLFVTHSKWGGWHHVEVHDPDWWIYKMESYGFRYSDSLTQRVRHVAAAEHIAAMKQPHDSSNVAPNGANYNAQHVWLTMMVFINPTVAALPQHAHLFAEPGCFVARQHTQLVSRACGEVDVTTTNKNNKSHVTPSQLALETPLPPEYKPLPLTDEMDTAWYELIRKHVPMKNTTKRVMAATATKNASTTSTIVTPTMPFNKNTSTVATTTTTDSTISRAERERRMAANKKANKNKSNNKNKVSKQM